MHCFSFREIPCSSVANLLLLSSNTSGLTSAAR